MKEVKKVVKKPTTNCVVKTLKDGRIAVIIDPKQNFGVSQAKNKNGELKCNTEKVASSQGNIVIGKDSQGRDITMGLNAWVSIPAESRKAIRLVEREKQAKLVEQAEQAEQAELEAMAS